VAERQHWDEYMKAYEKMIEATSSEEAPWHVIPSDRKWYRNWAVEQLLVETLRDLDPRYPEPALDVDRLRQRLQPPF